MPAKERAITGEKNKKTTDDVIPGKEKSKDRRQTSLPEQESAPGKTGRKSNQDEPKAKKQNQGENNDNDKGKSKPKKKDGEKES
jgi:hypothetical protein